MIEAATLPERTLLAAAVANVRLHGMEPWGLHGLAHWWRVRHNGLLVADAMGASSRVVKLFAIFHDSHRADDNEDPEHGPRAAAWLERVRAGDTTIRRSRRASSPIDLISRASASAPIRSACLRQIGFSATISSTRPSRASAPGLIGRAAARSSRCGACGQREAGLEGF